MGVRHEYVVISDESQPTTAARPSMHRDTFAEHVAMANNETCFFTFEFKILGDQPDPRKREKLTTVTDFSIAVENRRSTDPTSLTQFHAMTDHGVRSHDGSRPDHSARVDNSRVVYV